MINVAFGLLIHTVISRTSLAEGTAFWEESAAEAISNVFTFAPIALLLFWYVRKYERRGIKTLGLDNSKAIIKSLQGGLIALVMIGLVFFLMFVFEQVEVSAGSPRLRTGYGLLGLLLLLIGRLVQASSEEIVFRGWLLPILYNKWGLFSGIAISSLIFGLIHVFNNPSALAIFNLCLYGFFLALYAVREGSIWGVCAWHTVWNWAEVNIFGFSTSGDSAGEGLLFSTNFTGEDLFTGGSLGTNGSLFLTIILLIGILILFRKTKIGYTQQGT